MARTTKSKAPKTIPVVVTTKHRGVFFGYADPRQLDAPTIRLERMRNCLRWHRSIGGIFGLAQTGPNQHCLIGARVLAFRVHDVTSVAECTREAELAWEAAPCVS